MRRRKCRGEEESYFLFVIFFFFFKRKTAYEISACLVGSEVCIGDSTKNIKNHEKSTFFFLTGEGWGAASYTHLTLPTIYPVQISVVAGSLKKKTSYLQFTVSNMPHLLSLSFLSPPSLSILQYTITQHT